MIVIAIIGILAAIAIPQFGAYRKRGYNTSAIWDVKNAATAQESYYVDHKAYANSTNPLGGYGLSSTHGVTLTVVGNNDSYTLVSYHESGDRTYTISGPGGSLESN
ncbi:MAG: pilus assembly protein [Deltaproteobacteria bacterium]|nr:pilus assembly protein [Deltaproteobacteria bacterium]